MAITDVYEVVDVQVLQDQEVINLYYYEQRAIFVPLSGSVAQALAEEWVETILPQIVTSQAPAVLHTEVRVRNLFNPVDNGVAVSGLNGATAGTDTLPALNAFGFTFEHDNALIRPGSKRLAGVGESFQTEGIPTAPMIDELNLTADAMEQPITGGLIIEDDVMFPVVVKRINEGAPGVGPYRLPENVGEKVVGLITEVLVKLFVTSQVSRKFGVGV